MTASSELKALAIALKYSHVEAARHGYAEQILNLTAGRELTPEEAQIRAAAEAVMNTEKEKAIAATIIAAACPVTF